MADRPIIFSAPMIRALLDGRKTQTRRLLREDKCGAPILPAVEGDRLWVRETWKPGSWREDGRVAVDYRASPEQTNTPWISLPDNLDWDDIWLGWTDELRKAGSVPDKHGFHRWEAGQSPLRWRSPIHMPRWASRLTLIVTDVRVQRLQDISEADAVAEGVTRCAWSEDMAGDGRHEWHVPEFVPGEYPGLTNSHPTPVGAFAELWNTLHGPGAWAANQWVAAITFNVRKGNIDKEPTDG